MPVGETFVRSDRLASRSQMRRLQGAGFYCARYTCKAGQLIGENRVAEHQLYLATLRGVRAIDYVITEFICRIPDTTGFHSAPVPGRGRNLVTVGIHPLNQQPEADVSAAAGGAGPEEIQVVTWIARAVGGIASQPVMGHQIVPRCKIHVPEPAPTAARLDDGHLAVVILGKHYPRLPE